MSKRNLLEVVRAKTARGERNMTRAEANRLGAAILDGQPVQDKHGRPVPPKPTPGKPRIDLADKADQKPADDKKEN